MGSPSIVDGLWLRGDCDGVLHAYDVRNPTVDPPELWQVPLGNCIESTPAVWNGRVYIGTRGGFVYGIGDG
jgi:outer membrane protein assembly factor BamB